MRPVRDFETGASSNWGSTLATDIKTYDLFEALAARAAAFQTRNLETGIELREYRKQRSPRNVRIGPIRLRIAGALSIPVLLQPTPV